MHLANLLADHGLPTCFDLIDNWVWCYAHVIDLACKAVINNLSNLAELPDFILCKKESRCKVNEKSTKVKKTAFRQ